jgi:hypothetical protein
MFTVLCSGDIRFDITSFFEPYVRQWLINTDSKTEQWVKAVSIPFAWLFSCLIYHYQAIAADKVLPRPFSHHANADTRRL